MSYPACLSLGARRPLIVKVCILASSSSGNCTFIATSRVRILVDAGLSKRETQARLNAIGESLDSIDAILVSHEHSDHVCGLGAVTRHRDGGIPIYMTSLTARAMDWNDYTPPLESFQAGSAFCVGDIEIDSFTIPHDACDPVGFCFRAGGVKIGVVTDLGYLTESVKYHLRDADMLILESNHDLEMLKVGPYPWPVKQRVMGRRGHLSNEVVGAFLRNELDIRTTTLVLGHLSEHNNHPEIVRLVASQALEGRSLFTRLVIAEPGRQSEVFEY